MESNVFYWNWIRARKYKRYLNEEKKEIWLSTESNKTPGIVSLENRNFLSPPTNMSSQDMTKKHFLKNILLSKSIKDYVKIMNKDTLLEIFN